VSPFYITSTPRLQGVGNGHTLVWTNSIIERHFLINFFSDNIVDPKAEGLFSNLVLSCSVLLLLVPPSSTPLAADLGMAGLLYHNVAIIICKSFRFLVDLYIILAKTQEQCCEAA
jgi:hypothetical protein